MIELGNDNLALEFEMIEMIEMIDDCIEDECMRIRERSRRR